MVWTESRESWPGISRRPRSRRCEKSALIYQHSDDERQREVAAGLDDLRAQRAKHHNDDPPRRPAHHNDEADES
ncbi:hypothetical protein [Streptomyces sp. NPDC050121]|uniref:hypothetical protein n=1 Tax=Streptomyces sp. NPDC050121 TaxID=3365601 RepID=UPI00378C4E08